MSSPSSSSASPPSTLLPPSPMDATTPASSSSSSSLTSTSPAVLSRGLALPSPPPSSDASLDSATALHLDAHTATTSPLIASAATTPRKLISKQEALKNQWEERYRELKAFKEEHGHTNIPQRSTEFRSLGIWLKTQRSKKRAGRLDVEKQQKLDELGISWGISRESSMQSEEIWEAKFEALKLYKKKFGHCNVPSTPASEGNEYETLGVWLKHQRSNKRKGKLRKERKRKLKKLGVIWEPKKQMEKIKRMKMKQSKRLKTDATQLHEGVGGEMEGVGESSMATTSTSTTSVFGGESSSSSTSSVDSSLVGDMGLASDVLQRFKYSTKTNPYLTGGASTTTNIIDSNNSHKRKKSGGGEEDEEEESNSEEDEEEEEELMANMTADYNKLVREVITLRQGLKQIPALKAELQSLRQLHEHEVAEMNKEVERLKQQVKVMIEAHTSSLQI
ncbi:HA domain-containing protein [Balamuthia mandrillaris]